LYIKGNIKWYSKDYQAVQTIWFSSDSTLMDGEFETLRGDLEDLGVATNIAAPDEHVGDIERYISEQLKNICGQCITPFHLSIYHTI
jgi:hypothetical protein